MIFSKSKTILSYRSHQNVKILSMGLIIYFLNSCGTQQEEWKTSESSPKNTPKMVLSTLSGTPSTAGDNATFTVSLLTRPGENMVIDVSSSDTTLGTVSPDNLTFSKDNFTTAQTVTVTGQCDNQSGGGSYTLTASAASYYSADNQSISASNEEKADFKISSISGNITETGDNATFSVHLCTAPTSSVSFPVTSSDTTEGTVSTSTLSYSTSNWNTAQTVTVYGVDDTLSDDNQAFSVTLGSVTSSDANYAGKNPDDVRVTNVDNETASITVSALSGNTTEMGGTATFTVVLDSQPTSDVSIAVSSSDTSEATISPSSLTFDSSNYSTLQTVTVTGVDDFYDDDNVSYTITVDPSSSIASYNTMTSSTVTGSNIDNDTAAITVGAKSGNTSEFGTTATINVTLATIPTANVSIVVTDNDSSEVSITPTTLTITPSTWNTTNQVTLTGQDDSDNDGNITFRISFGNATSTDSKYNGMAPSPAFVDVINVDDYED